ncbi:MAG: hypothetical protein D6682_07385 [Zetaproteobacteria bacterium]|nr:MAG: hypothetical protein D6682_07385 [Zetaproteobacteria bacterium]
MAACGRRSRCPAGLGFCSIRLRLAAGATACDPRRQRPLLLWGKLLQFLQLLWGELLQFLQLLWGGGDGIAWGGKDEQGRQQGN